MESTMSAFARLLACLAVLIAAGTMSASGQNQGTRPAPLPPPKSQEPPMMVLPMEDYQIGPEDVLDIVVWGQTEVTRTVQVRPDGRISLPLVNDLRAAGLTPMQLRAALIKSFAESDTIKNAEVSVIVKEVHSMRVSVVGQVKMSGRFELRNRMTVLDAIALAGGFTDFAKKDRIRVQRRDATVVSVPYDRLMDESDPRVNFLLLAGDIVIIP
jgi:polysaccharide export outer membrane protein